MTPEIDQLAQLQMVTRDGDLISKDATDKLRKVGYAYQKCGYNFLSSSGVALSVVLGLLPSLGVPSTEEELQEEKVVPSER